MIIYDDGLSFTTARPDGDWVSDRPFLSRGDGTHQVITWPHIVQRGNYTPLALDTEHPEIAAAKLVDETGFQDIRGNLTRFLRVYATVPATRSDYESYIYQYLRQNFLDTSGEINVQRSRRIEESLNVTSRIEREYFNTSDPSTIDVLFPFKVLRNYGSGNIGQVNFISSSALPSATIPTLEEYLMLPEIIAEASTIRRYRGNIWERSTRYVPTETDDGFDT